LQKLEKWTGVDRWQSHRAHVDAPPKENGWLHVNSIAIGIGSNKNRDTG
jgi:hypothetical protein